MCNCRYKDCPNEFVYGVDEKPCWFEELDYTEASFSGFKVCYVYIGDNVLRIHHYEVVRRKDLELM